MAINKFDSIYLSTKRMEEIWRPVEGYEGVEVSNQGKVRKISYYSLQKDPKGYSRINLCKGGKISGHLVHRLIGDAFLEKKSNKTEIDHINRNRADNRVENLRWVDRAENCQNSSKFSREHHYIAPQPCGSYHVRIVRYKKILISKSFATLEEAIQARDYVLFDLNLTPIDSTI